MRLSKRLVQASWWEGLVVGRAGCCSGGQSSVKLLSPCLLMGGVGFPPCWLFSLRRPSTGAYLGSLVGLIVDSGRAHAKEYFPELLLLVSLSWQWATATPCLCRRPSNTSRWVWFSVLWSHCSFSWVLMHTLLCVCPSRVEYLFTPVLSKSCSQIPLAFKVWFSNNSSSHCWTRRLGSLMWDSEPSLQWVDSVV